MVKFYLIRHGETDWNVESRFQGRENISLNETGQKQAEACGLGMLETGIPFDCMVSSPLDRAYGTAETIAGCLGIAAIHKEPDLIERDFGKISGRKREDREWMLASGEDLQIEDEELVAERMQRVLDRFCKGDFRHVIMVSHGASIRALLGKYAKAGSVPATEVQRNACLTTIVHKEDGFYLEAFDKTPKELVRETAVYDLLDRLRIKSERVFHEPLFTMEACQDVDEALGIKICKNLFLCNSSRTRFYLLLMPGDKKFVTKEVSKQIGSARLSFGPKEYMEKYLNLTPGSVSLMGLMFDTQNKVELLIDRDVLEEEYFGCHPCVNTSSLKMKTADILKKFLPAVHHTYTEVVL